MKTNDFDEADESEYNEEEAVLEEGSFDGVPSPKPEEEQEYHIEDDSYNGEEILENNDNYSDKMKNVVLEQRGVDLGDNDALRMIETFNTIKNSTFELANLSNLVIQEVDQLIQIGSQKQEDFSSTINEYRKSKEGLEVTLQKLQDYFVNDNGIISKVETLEKIMQENYIDFADNMQRIGATHRLTIENNLKEIITKLNTIGTEINVDQIIKHINSNIDKKFKNVQIDGLEKSLERFEKANSSFNKMSSTLLGDGKKNGKKGLFYDLSDQMDKSKEYLDQFQNKFNLWTGIAVFFGGLFLGAGTMWFIAQQNMQSSFIKYSLDSQVEFNKKLSELKDQNSGYEEFKKRYGINGKDSGFGYFQNTKKPYFFYDSKQNVYKIGDKVYVEL